MQQTGRNPLAQLHNSNGSWMPMTKRASTLQTNGAKIAVNPEENVRGHTKRIEDWIESSQNLMREYKKEIEMLR